MGGQNWRSTLGDFAAISGVLAGFCFTLIVFILGSSIGNSPLICGTTWGQIGVLLTGISSALFITAAELFLTARDHDVWSLPQVLADALREGFTKKSENWDKIWDDNDAECRLYEKRGRRCYNGGIFTIFAALGFVIGPYNLVISIVVAGTGIGLELYQVLSGRFSRASFQ